MNSANEVQESIKIALDAADAATDVTSEYNKIKSENKKLEASVKQIHKFTTIIFGVSILAAVIGLSLTALIYSRTMNELTAMTSTSREALVVFAENVEGVKTALQDLEKGIDEQAKILETNNGVLCGYCNPKGRLISIFYIFQLDNVFYLYTTLDTAEPLLKKLNMYKMMSKVEFEIQDDILFGISAKQESRFLSDHILDNNKAKKSGESIIFKIGDNQVIILAKSKDLGRIINIESSNILGYKSFEFLDIQSIIPFINKSQIESFTPQMISLDILNGVSFSKGCYPGQEIVARTHYLGEAKKILCKIKFSSKKAILIFNSFIFLFIRSIILLFVRLI